MFANEKKKNKNTRYFIDIDLNTLKIINWDYDQRDKLAVQVLINPSHQRIYITLGQYNKLEKKHFNLLNKTAKKSKN